LINSCYLVPNKLSSEILYLFVYTELVTGRVHPRVGSGRVGSGRVGSGRENLEMVRVGSGQPIKFGIFFTNQYI
jgi:hypothetical protein